MGQKIREGDVGGGGGGEDDDLVTARGSETVQTL